MLSKIQSSVVLLISFAYGIFDVWNIIGAPSEDLVLAVVSAVFALLGVIFGGTQLKQAISLNVTGAKIESLKRAA